MNNLYTRVHIYLNTIPLYANVMATIKEIKDYINSTKNVKILKERYDGEIHMSYYYVDLSSNMYFTDFFDNILFLKGEIYGIFLNFGDIAVQMRFKIDN